MRSRYRITESDRPHFITSTIVEWLPVFTTATRCEVLIDSFRYCREQKGLRIYAWVLLDNHFHAVVAGANLARTLADLKKFTAHKLLALLEVECSEWLVNQLAYFRAQHKTASQHQVWQEGSHPEAILSDAMMEQKIDYTHQNPVKRGLVATAEHWRYSSAHEWLPGAQPVIRCDPWK